MLKSILNLSQVSIISKKNQSTIQGGFVGGDCLVEPGDCEAKGGFLFNCVCIDRDTGLPT
ncbi:hypothetical protein GCM10009430_42530 [Aquimarina litoralis]|uniref:Bacteriocin n=1 Tax=Aquimarina litoralis TaxID=584605 RepID=A0ABP3UI89_9FLAO